jgi:multidrug efflux pump subunit AcrA (membrane-fusion protein)
MTRAIPRTAVRLAAPMVLAAVAAACGEPPPATPPLERAALERAVRILPAPADRRPHITVPAAAMVDRGGMPGVLVLNDDGRARFRLVKPGERRGDSVEIIAGLFGGERIVMGELAEVRDGTPIKIED